MQNYLLKPDGFFTKCIEAVASEKRFPGVYCKGQYAPSLPNNG